MMSHRTIHRITIAISATILALSTALVASQPARADSLLYHGGPVIGTSTTYAIFWLPAGQHFEPAGDDSRYENRVRSFLQDVGSTPYYNILTEYSTDAGKTVNGGPIQNASTLAGSYVDTAAYTHAGTTADPLQNADFRDAVQRAITANGWTPDANSIFFVYTAANVQVCGFPSTPTSSSSDVQACTFSSATAFAACTGRGSFTLNGKTALYAMVPGANPDCGLPDPGMSPIGDPLADVAVLATNQNLVDAVTDPLASGWNLNGNSGEIGDLCFDPQDVSLHANTYMLLGLWSNAAGRCVHSRPPEPVPGAEAGLRYHFGSIMPTTTTYSIFWLPPGNHFEPQGSDTAYESLMNQFFKDVGGTFYYNVMTQYSTQPNGSPVHNSPLQNISTFGGAYVDTTPYPHAGTTTDPLLGGDISDEVVRAMKANGWTPSLDRLYTVFTAADVNLCFDSSEGSSCTFSNVGSPGGFCAYHSLVPVGDSYAIYILEPNIASLDCASPVIPGFSPNNDAVADAEFVTLSHELMESVTDPLGFGWWGGTIPLNTEIGDYCQTVLDNGISKDGGNVTLHGHRYKVQSIYSNADKGCVFSYPPAKPKPKPMKCKKGYKLVKVKGKSVCKKTKKK